MPHPFLDKNVSWGPPPGEGEAYDVHCPVCGYDCVSAGPPQAIDASAPYGAKWGGKGDLLVIPFDCEGGCSWELCIGFHKGNSIMFVRNLKTETGQEYGPPSYDDDQDEDGPPDYDT